MNEYTAEFYASIRDGARASAQVVVPAILDHIDPRVRNVIDVGCGEGWWASEFTGYQCTVTGIDGAHVTPIPGSCCTVVPHDLAQPIPPSLGLGRFDLAVCLEVAARLPESRADGLVGDLCALAPTVVFSAARPGQGGAGHVNERPVSYWAGLFDRRGYRVSGALRWEFWNNSQVEFWCSQNMIVASAAPERMPSLYHTPLATSYDVVHPALFNARRTS